MGGTCGLVVTAQSLLQKPQAVLPGLHKGGKLVTQAQGWGSRRRGRCEALSTAYLHSEAGDLPARSLFQGTVLIWGEERWVLPLYLCFLESPAPNETSIP